MADARIRAALLAESLLFLFAVSCGDSGGADATDADTTGSATSLGCAAALGPNAVGEHCLDDADCQSGLCVQYQDTPDDADAHCQPRPSDCNTFISGTVFRFPAPGSERVPLENVQVAISTGEEIVSDARRVAAFAQGLSRPDGRFEALTTEPLSSDVSLVAVVHPDTSYAWTASGLALPYADGSFGPGTALHEVWAVPQQMLNVWTLSLAAEPHLMPWLPLGGDEGGVVGLVRTPDGEPAPGIRLKSDLSAMSKARIRYLNEDGTFGRLETSSTGIVVILGKLGVEGHPNEQFDLLTTSGKKAGRNLVLGSPAGAVLAQGFDVD